MSIAYRTIGRLDDPKATTRRGTPYVTLSSGGLVPEGAIFMLFETAIDAIDAYENAFNAWLGGRDPSGVSWRCYPELTQWTPTPTMPRNGPEKTAYYVYSRLAYEAAESAVA